MAGLDDKKAFLLKPDAEGNCVFDHITDLLVTIVEEQPRDALGSFELRSAQAKIKRANPTFNPHAFSVARASELADMFEPPLRSLNEDGEVVEPEVNTEVDIFEFDATLFEKAGVGLGATESYRIALAMENLAKSVEEQLDTVRFWGKVFGTAGNYIVCEATPKEVGEPIEQSEQEKKTKVVATEAPGTGANSFVYYVCSNAGQKWMKLPDVRPDHIMCARAIKKVFTGDLTTKIEGYPVFPGSEAELLRAQIARITIDTNIAPAGFFEMPGGEDYDPEEDPDAEPLEAEDYSAPSDLPDLIHPSNWVHRTRGLLQTQGRCTWFQAEEEEEEQDESTYAPPAQKPEPELAWPHLMSLATDPKIGKLPAWTLRVCCGALPSSAVAVVKSVKWAGAVTVGSFGGAKGVTWSSVYVGDGIKYSCTAYSPPLPPRVEMEFDDSEMVEMVDPTPEEEAEAMAFEQVEEQV